MSEYIFPVPETHLPIPDNVICENPVVVSQKLYEFYETKKFVDIDLIVGRNTFRIPAHRLILAASSQYFYDEFTLKPQKSYLEIPKVDEVVMQWIIRFMYTSSIDLKPHTVKRIFKAAVLFQMTILIDACLTFMGENINADNCLGFAKLAWDFDKPSILKQCFAFAHKNFEEVRKKDEFFELSADLLRELLESDFLQVTSEEVILQMLIDWANFDPSNRHSLLADLLNVVRFEMLDLLFLTRIRESTRNIPNCDDVVFKWLTYHIENHHQGFIPKIRARNMSHNYSILCGESTDNWYIMTFNGMLDTWSREALPSSERKRKYFKAVKTVDNRVIISGGKVNGQPTSSVESFDLQLKTWKTYSSMRETRFGHVMAMIKGNLYVMGGFNDDCSPQMSVERYNTYTRCWDNIGIMPSPIEYSHRYAIINDRIYITNTFRPKKLRCFDSLLFQWSCHDFDYDVNKVVDMVAIGDDLYFYLIASDERILTRFSPTEMEWTQLPSEGIDRFMSTRMFAFCYKLVFFGKANDGSGRILVEMYDPDSGEFTALAPLEEDLMILNIK